MTELDEFLNKLWQQATVLMKNGSTVAAYEKSNELFRQYIHGGGERQIEAIQMMAVNDINRGAVGIAVARLDALLERSDVSSHDRGNIERDLGRAYQKIGAFDEAAKHLSASLELHLGHDDFAYAASLGFRGRLFVARAAELRPGATSFDEWWEWMSGGDQRIKARSYLICAGSDFYQAEAILRSATDKRLRLYNLLDFASQQLQVNNWLEGKTLAWRAVWLAFGSDPETKLPYGARKHQVRALALLFGGWRFTNWLSQRKRP